MAEDPTRQNPDRLLAIGLFARLTGLSVGALRHYDTIGLLRPARIDTGTSYRSYAVDQVERGRLIVALKDLEMPLEEIREVLEADDPRERRRLVAAHHQRLGARTVRLQRMAHRARHLSDPTIDHEPEERTMPTPTPPDLDRATERSIAVGLFNRVWEMLELAERSADQDEQMLNAAHASRHHWGQVGGLKEWAVGDWQISRVYAVLGRGEPAVHHARRCHALATRRDDGTGEQLPAWVLGSAYEALSRAYSVAGDVAAAREWRAKAEAQLALIDDPDDRAVVSGDVATLPV